MPAGAGDRFGDLILPKIRPLVKLESDFWQRERAPCDPVIPDSPSLAGL